MATISGRVPPSMLVILPLNTHSEGEDEWNMGKPGNVTVRGVSTDQRQPLPSGRRISYCEWSCGTWGGAAVSHGTELSGCFLSDTECWQQVSGSPGPSNENKLIQPLGNKKKSQQGWETEAKSGHLSTAYVIGHLYPDKPTPYDSTANTPVSAVDFSLSMASLI
ncbi:hypothetical protein JZ751_009525 [Albula glossodonta]|uniref:Uncharacterized protein n=1 Tax=Albula glossodonta TaxID=121402 RepID=A0A8T2NXD0_9TELE|nr:hypothetical protein JZ751_009525 [Albula glossodonta]